MYVVNLLLVFSTFQKFYEHTTFLVSDKFSCTHTHRSRGCVVKFNTSSSIGSMTHQIMREQVLEKKVKKTASVIILHTILSKVRGMKGERDKKRERNYLP